MTHWDGKCRNMMCDRSMRRQIVGTVKLDGFINGRVHYRWIYLDGSRSLIEVDVTSEDVSTWSWRLGRNEVGLEAIAATATATQKVGQTPLQLLRNTVAGRCHSRRD